MRKSSCMTPVVLHVPHSSVDMPEDHRSSFLCDPEKELALMTDHLTEELFSCLHQSVVFPISRLICDVERFRDDEAEPMSGRGMGAVYTRCHDGSPLRVIQPGEREEILRRWYDPHHAELTRQAESRLSRFGRCLIVDCHSFSARPLPYEPVQDPLRPDICVGTDPFHTPEHLAEAAEDVFRSKGYGVMRNSPFAGALTPLKYYRRDTRVAAIMLEINRGLYLDGSRPGSNFARVRLDVIDVIAALTAAFEAMPLALALPSST